MLGQRTWTRKIRHAGLGLLVAALVGLFATPAQAAEPEQIPPGSFVVLDPASGKVISIQPLDRAGLEISNTNICSTASYACFYSGQVPYAHQGFYGTPGTFFGSWPYRSGGRSGGYTTQFCWINGGTVCSPILPPGTTFSYGSSRFTGTSVTIF
ncbi:hypothetical protein F4553_007217 [Allocatelliglobosispora scoriae]|uniref:Secreted protein n=1 Tax=Allocatelliglobosispora scoriae TaxID=643052 RepID=A0A841C3S1_9ACTN|nr:hypothetical protein [Allocatelliglobosispora scoriae]MBB5873783.1 hypothetical protein [Allocatelliglobosispora scoriae]